jgi:hypothetical protein
MKIAELAETVGVDAFNISRSWKQASKSSFQNKHSTDLLTL